jgi:hypothetical protein
MSAIPPRQGFMWFATYEDLLRFDSRDAGGPLWIGTQSAGRRGAGPGHRGVAGFDVDASLQTPNSKLPTPKPERPRSRKSALEFGVWNLELIWALPLP